MSGHEDAPDTIPVAAILYDEAHAVRLVASWEYDHAVLAAAELVATTLERIADRLSA